VSLLALDGTPESIGGRKANDLVWTLYEIEYQDLPGDMALAERDGLALLVLLMKEPDEREGMREAVFLPVVDGLAPLAQPAVDVANAFMQALKDADYGAAYALCDPDLQAEFGTAADLGTWMTDSGIRPVEWIFPERNLAAEAVQVLGTGLFPGDQQATVEVVLVQVDGEWRVAGFRVE